MQHGEAVEVEPTTVDDQRSIGRERRFDPLERRTKIDRRVGAPIDEIAVVVCCDLRRQVRRGKAGRRRHQLIEPFDDGVGDGDGVAHDADVGDRPPIDALSVDVDVDDLLLVEQ